MYSAGVREQAEVRPAARGQVPAKRVPRAGERGVHLPVQQGPRAHRLPAHQGTQTSRQGREMLQGERIYL